MRSSGMDTNALWRTPGDRAFRILRRVTNTMATEVLAPDGLPVDPTLIAEAAALEEVEAARRHAELAEQIDAANEAYYGRRADDA